MIALVALLAAQAHAESVEIYLALEPEGVAESWTVDHADVGALVHETIERGPREHLEVTVDLTERLEHDGQVDQVVFEATIERVQTDRRGREVREVLSRPRVTTLSDTEAVVKQGARDRRGEMVSGLELRIVPRLDDDVPTLP